MGARFAECDGECRAEQLHQEARKLEWLADAFWNVPTVELIEEGAALFAGGTALEDVDLRKAAVEYTGLICSCVEGSPFPYESVYSDGSRLLMRPVRDEVLAFYVDNGFTPNGGEGNEPEDHVSTELRFMAHLLRREASLLKCDASQAAEISKVRVSFKQAHLDKWVPVFCDEVIAKADAGFMRDVSELLKAQVG